MSNGGKTISGFLDALADDPELEYRFRDNAIKTMSEFGLSKEQRGTVLGGTVGEIRDAIRQEGQDPQAVVFVIRRR